MMGEYCAELPFEDVLLPLVRGPVAIAVMAVGLACATSPCGARHGVSPATPAEIRRAIADIIQMDDPHAFVKKSGWYPGISL
jgi:hypothetical protein